jgi:hypothetical protein
VLEGRAERPPPVPPRSKSRRRVIPRIAAVLISGILLAIWPAVAPAQATMSSGVTITSTVNLNTDPATGTWTATGAVNDAGTLSSPGSISGATARCRSLG